MWFIDGRRLSPEGPGIDNINPATGQVICSVPSSGADVVETAVQAARRAQKDWGRRPGAERGRVLQRLAALLREHNDRLAKIEVEDTGKPWSEASVVDVQSAADAVEYYAGLASKLHGDHYDLPPTAFAYTRREPLGVCVGIGAWNYPLQIAAWKAAPALACGNAMVFKPSEFSPRSAVELAELMKEAGLPDGLFNVVQGGKETGQFLTQHPHVAKVSFTGGAATGKRVAADATNTLKRVTMELGGKSPLLIFDDAHLENAVAGALMANFYTQGEICTNAPRVFVHEELYPQFLQALLPRVARLRVGDPMNPDTQVGALISAPHRDRVLDYIRSGEAEGAELLAGGEAVTVAGCEEGYFVRPAVFGNCKDTMKIVREEIFGPVMTLLVFQDEYEAIRRANDTPYGLASGVFTQDLARAHRVAAQLDAGTCWINNYNLAPIEMPFGGFKESGLGYENSLVTVEQYTRLKTVHVEMGDVECPF